MVIYLQISNLSRENSLVYIWPSLIVVVCACDKIIPRGVRRAHVGRREGSLRKRNPTKSSKLLRIDLILNEKVEQSPKGLRCDGLMCPILLEPVQLHSASLRTTVQSDLRTVLYYTDDSVTLKDTTPQMELLFSFLNRIYKIYKNPAKSESVKKAAVYHYL